MDTGWSLRDNCFTVDSPQALVNCHLVTPFKGQTQLKLNGSYPLPKDFLIAATFQNLSGPEYEANYPATTAEIKPSLGSGSRGRRTNGDGAADRRPTRSSKRGSRVSISASARSCSMGPRRRLQINLDAYNALNGSGILAVNNTFDARWRQPTSIIDPRLFQFSGNFTF